VHSAPPVEAERLYRNFGALLRDQWPEVAEGRFGAMMDVSLTNRGPVTLIVDRDGAGESM
jgi:D-tyrosyl-tRNA(Tyr) deacylase